MKFSNGITAIVVICATAVASTSASVLGGNDEPNRQQHRGLVRRIRNENNNNSSNNKRSNEEPEYVNLQKRFGGQATFYNNAESEGACGGYTSPGDYIVALNIEQYGNPNSVSSWCGKQIQITYGGKTRTATVVDCCPSCAYGSLDMSQGLFSSFASLGQGVFQMSWQPVGGGGGGSSSGGSSSHNNNNDDDGSSSNSGSDGGNDNKNQNKQTTTSSTPKPTTHSSTSKTSTTPKTTSTSLSTSSSSSSTPTPTSTSLGNLANLNEVYNGLYNMANAVGGH